MTSPKQPQWAAPDVPEFALTEFVVDATDDEMHQAWWKWSQVHLVPWEEVLRGYSVEIGKVANRPVVVCVIWAWINGHCVAFVEGVSALVDHTLIEAWQRAVFPCLGLGGERRHSNMTNFGHAIAFCMSDEPIPRDHNMIKALLGRAQDTSWHGPAAKKRRGAST